MLFLHEVHRVAGAKETDFEAAFREAWMPALAKGDDARLLWYFHHAHGSGPSYNFVTVTAVKDWQAWERLALRVQRGDLQEWAAQTDRLRYGVAGKVLKFVPWSRLEHIDLTAIPASPGTSHDLSVYVEDTVWPAAGRRQNWMDGIGSYFGAEDGRGETATPNGQGESGAAFAELVAGFTPAWAAGRQREAVLLHRVRDLDRLARFYMGGHDADASILAAGPLASSTEYRWESRVLRTSAWSPLD